MSATKANICGTSLRVASRIIILSVKQIVIKNMEVLSFDSLIFVINDELIPLCGVFNAVFDVDFMGMITAQLAGNNGCGICCSFNKFHSHAG